MKPFEEGVCCSCGYLRKSLQVCPNSTSGWNCYFIDKEEMMADKIDYKKILKAYMKDVSESEGVFLGENMEFSGLTNAEIFELDRLKDEINREDEDAKS